LTLNFRIEPTFPILIYGEPQILVQIANNLFSNAIKFTKSGSISLSAAWETDPVEMMTIDVKDTGIGMTPGQQQAIFHRFSQATADTMRQFGGTGLGLALVRNLITELKGTINFDSEYGKGTTFHVRLPFKSIAVPYPEVFPAGESQQIVVVSKPDDPDRFLIEFATFYNFTPIVVPDVPKLEAAISDLVRCIVVDVEKSAGCAAAVRDFVRNNHPELVLCSLSLPGMSLDFPKVITKPLLPHHLRALLDDVRYRHSTGGPKVPRMSSAACFGKRVLVAEDNKVNQLVMSKALSKLGIEFKIANNGAEALECLETDTFDLIFMDCKMPVMDGLEATRAIRASGKPYKKLPIVALTASAIEGDEDRCREAGMNGYIAKPVRVDQLTQAMKKYAT
jgi:CheY-like chemotaxis protein